MDGMTGQAREQYSISPYLFMAFLYNKRAKVVDSTVSKKRGRFQRVFKQIFFFLLFNTFITIITNKYLKRK